ncbi:class I SAM-dependent methyltransferase [Isachenkonia alkalipeptolytica]|uniref:Class I SAM-dependent methyltransferase n=1 Tax=Isachenkonia alkalipeptolytica TaxID=2565777 RepID=A0AA43XJA7_9CLOT|nr:class I SAM-dependent methyltransferase [Isachenkonia alkalipeptolytica]NBG87878.1 class I SAM-dependent methyltransferase [Isachenkonia alkalipeptolytica]
MENLYQNPKYYEIAFSYRDIQGEVDTFEESIQRFSKIPVTNVLEIGCGNSPHMRELVNRGYRYHGIDLSEAMLDYAREKSKDIKGKVHFTCADMTDFTLPRQVDFVYIPLGSLYAKTNENLNAHFDSISRVLKKGGLYLLDWCVNFEPLGETKDSWEMEEEGILVETEFSISKLNKVTQTYEEGITLQVKDHGKEMSFTQKDLRRAIYPQEFLFLLQGREDFEFIGWWNDWDLNRPIKGTETISRPITIIRKQ